MEIGKLKEVEIRNLWQHEQYDFSDWLSKEGNIEMLNEILGLTLNNVSKEVYVGSYRCDLVATDESTGIKVVIENQLEISNHDHLGKIITYASGLNANAIVWIVKQAKEEHKCAIEWLNNNTSSEINFFLIELHAYKIEDSLPAPYFKVVEEPNDFIKNNKVNGNQNELNKSQAERLEFWTMFNEMLIEKGKPFNVRKATTDHWYDIAIGKSGVHVSVSLVNRDSLICLELYISDDKELFDRLYSKKEIIESELNMKLIWDRLDNGKASRIKYNIYGFNFANHANYRELMETIIEDVIKMRDTFKKHI